MNKRKLLADLKCEKGLTLVEMVIVAGVIVILCSIAVVGYMHFRDRARIAVMYSDIRLVKLAASRFNQDLGFFPLEVGAGVDPGLVSKYGWQDGAHSGAWETADANGMLDRWNGPYLKKWRTNPWGGHYDWENYPPGYENMGISGGAVFLSLKPDLLAGRGGMPPTNFEAKLQKRGVDASPWLHYIAVHLGNYTAPEG